MVNKHKEAVKRQREVAYVQKKEDKKTALETKSINDIIPIVDTFKDVLSSKTVPSWISYKSNVKTLLMHPKVMSTLICTLLQSCTELILMI